MKHIDNIDNKELIENVENNAKIAHKDDLLIGEVFRRDAKILDILTSISKEDSKRLFSKTLKYFRLEKNVSQRELARKLNSSFQQIQKYENGKVKIPLERIFRITHILNITIIEFLEKAFGKNIDNIHYGKV